MSPPVAADSRRVRLATTAILALVVYVPALLTRPGTLAADTKVFLFLDPGGMLASAGEMWDSDLVLGTVTHQNIGYLWPLAPYFWVWEHLPLPMWVGQRLWMATTLFAAGAGFVWLARRLGLTGWAVLAGALVYQLSPFTLAYLGRTTAIIAPWAALPWLIGLARRAGHEGGWRAPAWFALVVTTVGGVNASSLLFVGLGPVLWFPFAVWGARELELRRALAAVGRIALLLLPTQAWWIAGLTIQASYGLPILDLTETVETIAETSTASEVVRHLGYWYFYGGDGLEPWTPAARFYTQNLVSMVTSFAIPGLVAIAAFCVRWRYRAFAVLLFVVGALVGVGTHPYDDPTPVGALLKGAADSSAAAMAFRNSPRAVPLMVLGAALLLTAGLTALASASLRWRPRTASRLAAPTAVALVALLAVANLPPLWTGGMVQSNLAFPEDLPDHWEAASASLDASSASGRVLEIPGQDFGTYRWGNTQDVITPGLIDRPWVGRQLIPFGTPATADLIRAFDRRIQEGIFESSSIAPISALIGAEDVLLVSETQFERYRLPRPRPLWAQLMDGVEGLGDPVGFGEPTRNRAVPSQPMMDETELGTDPSVPDPAPLTTFPVLETRPEVRTSSAVSAIIAGDGDAVVELAAAGLLPEETFVFSGTFADDPERLEEMADAGARLVLTDTNRRRAQRWGTLRENNGYTEAAGETALVPDPTDSRLDVFPDADDDAFTTTRLRGVDSILASRYGNPVSYTPEDRPSLALDGDVGTAWRVGAFDEVRGERWVVELDGPTSTDHIEIVQSLRGDNRWITQLEVVVDGRSMGTVDLDGSSLTAEGQRIALDVAEIQTLELIVRDANVPRMSAYPGVSPVGIAEVRIGDVEVDEVVSLPSDLLAAVGPSAATAPLDVVLTRQRSNPSEPFRADPERAMARVFSLPAARQVDLLGTARLADGAPDDLLDSLLGLDEESTGLVVRSSDHLSGSIRSRASAAIDGDPDTRWSPGFTNQVGRWIEVQADRELTVDHLDLVLVADGRHSVPTRIAVEVDGQVAEVALPAVSDQAEENGVVEVPVDVPAMTGSSVRITILEVRETLTKDYYSESPIAMPIGIAELGLAGVTMPAPASTFDTGCRDDLLEIDGRATPVRISGSTASALDGRPLDLELCDASVRLPEGEVEVRTAEGIDTGLDLDRLILRSPASSPAVPTGAEPTVVRVEGQGLARQVHLDDVDGPFVLVLGRSHSAGWTAAAEGIGDLGEPVLVDGFANGWFVDPPDGLESTTITIEWTPQQRIWVALAISAAGLLLCGAILLWPTKDGGGRARASVDAPSLADPTRHDDGALSPRAAVVAGVVAALGGWALGGPSIGVALALMVGIAAGLQRGRPALSVVGALTLAPVAAYHLARQWRSSPRIGVEWPAAFDPSGTFVLLAILALGADAMVGWARRRWGRGGRQDEVPFQAPK